MKDGLIYVYAYNGWNTIDYTNNIVTKITDPSWTGNVAANINGEVYFYTSSYYTTYNSTYLLNLSVLKNQAPIGNLMTRKKLITPITKTSSQTMKVTYTFSFT
jgi:hypothetical protein